MIPTRVAIVEDDARIREVVRQLIDGETDLCCRGAYGSAEQALRALGGLPADILLLDIHLPCMEGSDAAKIFHGRFPAMRIVMFTVFDDDKRDGHQHQHGPRSRALDLRKVARPFKIGRGHESVTRRHHLRESARQNEATGDAPARGLANRRCRPCGLQ